MSNGMSIAPDVRAAVVAAVAGGMSLRKVVRKFGVARSTIQRWGKGTTSRRIFTAETKASMVAAVLAGEPRIDVATRFGCSTVSIEEWLRKARTTQPRDRSAELAAQKKPGRPQAQKVRVRCLGPSEACEREFFSEVQITGATGRPLPINRLCPVCRRLVAANNF